MSTGQLPGFANAAALPPDLSRADVSRAGLSRVGLSRAAAAVVPALAAAADRTGVDFGALFHTARLESGFNPSARAKTSSATGLFQFIDSTWLRMLNRHGAAHGLSGLPTSQALALRKDPAAASLMAAEHMAENAQALEAGLGRSAGRTDLYIAHFLGLGGALRFLRGMAETPQASGAAMFPAAARANRAIFHSGSAPRSLEQIHRLLGERLSGDAGVSGMDGAQQAAASKAPPGAKPRATPVDAGQSPASFSPAAPASAIAPADAARLAYLMLAELGG